MSVANKAWDDPSEPSQALFVGDDQGSENVVLVRLVHVVPMTVAVPVQFEPEKRASGLQSAVTIDA